MAGSGGKRGVAARNAALTAHAFILGLSAANLWSADWHVAKAPARFAAPSASSGWSGVAEQMGLMLDQVVSPAILIVVGCTMLLAAIVAVVATGPRNLLNHESAR